MGRFARGQVQLMRRVRTHDQREKGKVIMAVSTILALNVRDLVVSLDLPVSRSCYISMRRALRLLTLPFALAFLVPVSRSRTRKTRVERERRKEKKSPLLPLSHRHQSHGRPCIARGALEPLFRDLGEAGGARRGGSCLPCH
jgi:hypothetical protein